MTKLIKIEAIFRAWLNQGFFGIFFGKYYPKNRHAHQFAGVNLFVLNVDYLHNFYYGKSWAQKQFLPDSPKGQKV